MSEPATLELTLADEAATLALGARLARALPTPLAAALVIALSGELGTGKTTLVRGFLRELGVSGLVHSPTYTLVADYPLGSLRVAHVDLYRIRTVEELEELGIRELLEPDRVLLVEWPEQGGGGLPPADLSIRLEFAAPGRRAQLAATTPPGRRLLSLFR